MKLKIVFHEPNGQEIKTASDEQVLVIQSPYQVIQAELGDTRQYARSDGSMMPETFTYEQYCQETAELIHRTLQADKHTEMVYEQITLEGFRQPANFKAICTEIEKSPVNCEAHSKILLDNCGFGGALYTNSVSQYSG